MDRQDSNARSAAPIGAFQSARQQLERVPRKGSSVAVAIAARLSMLQPSRRATIGPACAHAAQIAHRPYVWLGWLRGQGQRSSAGFQVLRRCRGLRAGAGPADHRPGAGVLRARDSRAPPSGYAAAARTVLLPAWAQGALSGVILLPYAATCTASYCRLHLLYSTTACGRHRPPAASWHHAAFHTVTAVVGAGVLGLPHAFSFLGW